MIGKVLVANRGEIAVRVIRTCRSLGIRSVAVYSEADRESQHVALADESVQIGPPAPQDSYLSIPAMIEAARGRGADAIHPGYGFLSEDPDFAEVCAAEGFTFIGPSPKVLATLSDKASARTFMADVGLPLLPGGANELTEAMAAKALASEIGYPVILKPIAGGGGRGMRVIDEPGSLRRAWSETRANAARLFGDCRVFLEKYLPHARHIEVQVVADTHGGIVHLGTRDCTLQRRKQKIVEEAPAPNLPPELTQRICTSAVDGLAAAGYAGIGTVEFLLDTEQNFYFMEVNCRIQVEHPVTEMVSGIDLVAEQLRVAAGEELGYGQEQVSLHGAAVECRVNAEDPVQNFAPCPGELTRCRFPAGPFVRVDTHAFQGYTVPATYDPLLAKVITWAPDRSRAVRRMQTALSEICVDGRGVATNTDFNLRLLSDARFLACSHSTRLAESIAEGWNLEKGE